MDLPSSYPIHIKRPDVSCRTCCDLDPATVYRLHRETDAKSHYTGITLDPYELEYSSVSGCESCKVLWQGITTVLKNTDDFKWVIVEEVHLKFCSGYGLRAEVYWDKRNGYTDIEFYTNQNDTPAWPAFGIANDVPDVLNTEICVRHLKKWLATCFESHAACWNAGPFQPPGRLLDLEYFASGHIRLVKSSEMGEARYIALSHCWGSAQAKATTKANFREHCNLILLDDLPKTFREAAMITVGLDVRYLWIDSLCIIQDDLGDWEVESVKMATVYGLSYLTIAVLHSPDNHGGCFLERHWRNPMYWNQPHYAPSTSTNSIPLSIRRGTSVYTVWTRLAHKSAVSSFFESGHEYKAPLESRAWALQERLLAPRSLLIYPEELVWECKTTAACECQLLPYDTYFQVDSLYGRTSLKALIQPRQKPNSHQACNNWLSVISLYSQLHLTKYNDTLPALSGLAAYFSQFMDGKYMSGLWSDDFPRSLLWTSTKCTETMDESRPSWSWTAIHSGNVLNGGVQYHSVLLVDFVGESHFEFISCTPSEASSDFGSYTGDVLRVKGAVTEVGRLLHIVRASETRLKIVQSMFEYDICKDWEVRASAEDKVLQCILLGTATRIPIAYFLVLKPSGRSAACRRVGMLWVENMQEHDFLDAEEIVTIDIF